MTIAPIGAPDVDAPSLDAPTARVITDGLPPPQLNYPLKPDSKVDRPLGVDYWMRTDPTFRLSRNQAHVFIEGKEAFPALEELLQSANKSVRLDFYMFSGGEAARIAGILADKRRAGVDVRVLLDPHRGEIPKFQIPEGKIIEFLKANGIEVRFYPITRIVPGKPDAGRIDHNKIVIVDGQQAMTGGMNIVDDFLNNHDVMVKIAGPAVTDLRRQFDEAWSLAGDPASPADAVAAGTAEPPEQGDAQVRVVATGIDGRRSAESVIIDQLRNAKRRVYLEMFELVSPRMIDELIAAKQRGVDVRVLSDPGDHGRFLGFPVPTGFPNLPNLYRLRGAGIQVRWYDLAPGQVHDHLKLSVVDDAVVVGSLNWTDSALQSNAETSLEIRGGSAYRRILRMFADDWNNHSRPIPSPDFYRRGMQTLFDWTDDIS